MFYEGGGSPTRGPEVVATEFKYVYNFYTYSSSVFIQTFVIVTLTSSLTLLVWLLIVLLASHKKIARVKLRCGCSLVSSRRSLFSLYEGNRSGSPFIVENEFLYE